MKKWIRHTWWLQPLQKRKCLNTLAIDRREKIYWIPEFRAPKENLFSVTLSVTAVGRLEAAPPKAVTVPTISHRCKSATNISKCRVAWPLLKGRKIYLKYMYIPNIFFPVYWHIEYLKYYYLAMFSIFVNMFQYFIRIFLLYCPMW